MFVHAQRSVGAVAWAKHYLQTGSGNKWTIGKGHNWNGKKTMGNVYITLEFW